MGAPRRDPLRETCEEIHRTGGAAAYTTCDVRDYGAVEAAAAKAEEQFGDINTLVNNAAGNFMARTETLSANAFSAVVGIVLNGSFNCTQALAKRWIADKQGGNVLSIVFQLEFIRMVCTCSLLRNVRKRDR